MGCSGGGWQNQDGREGDRFLKEISTHWSALKGPPRAGLDYLAGTYGRAILSYLGGRLARGDFAPLKLEDRDDLLQELFLRLGRTEWLKKPDPSRGPFRQYFLGRLEYFLRERRAAALARLRRAPGCSLDEIPEPPAPDPLAEQLEKEWKEATIRKALAHIRRRNPAWFEALDACLEHPDRTDTETARQLGKSLPSYRSLLKRARKAFREVYPILAARLDGFGGESF
jgi:DNA-directed RNA polymerase specialized sigma24 family protein